MSDEGERLIRGLLKLRNGNLDDAVSVVAELSAKIDREVDLPKWSEEEMAEIEQCRREIELVQRNIEALTLDRPGSRN